MSRIRLISLALAALPLTSLAVETKTWLHSSQADYEKAEVKGLSLRSDGRITLAPAFREIFDSSAPYLWALAEDSKGNLYAGGGGSGGSTAKLFQIDVHGKSKVLAELDGLEIHAIAIDKKDRVYAATAPDGRIYRLSAAGKAEVFYDPKAKYIWAIAFDSKQNLFIATGDAGEIHKVTPDGKGSIFAKTEEVHVRSMVIDKQDNLIAGTEPGGLILRVSPAGEGFVLHQASKREVTAVAVAADGSIYAAAVGGKNATGCPYSAAGAGPSPAYYRVLRAATGATGRSPWASIAAYSGIPRGNPRGRFRSLAHRRRWRSTQALERFAGSCLRACLRRTSAAADRHGQQGQRAPPR